MNDNATMHRLLLPPHLPKKMVPDQTNELLMSLVECSADSSVDTKIQHFESLEYKGLYNFDKPFKVKSKKAYILNEDPDVVYMTDMYVILYLSEDRIVEITSLSGRYLSLIHI